MFQRIFPTLFIFGVYIFITAFFMYGEPLSDDQITYWVKTYKILNPDISPIRWDPTSTFSYFLAIAFWITNNINLSFISVYMATAFFYLILMNHTLEFFLKDKKTAILLSMASLTPFYTMAMTYWGFSSYEFVKARILIMPFVPIVIMLYYKALKHRESVGWSLFISSSLCLFNFEAAYLTASLILHYLFFGKKYQNSWRLFLLSFVYLAAAIFVVYVIYKLNLILRLASNTLSTSPSHDWMHLLRNVYHDYIYGLPEAQYTSLSWKAAYSAFWWSMFPPRLTDITFAIFNTLGLIIVSIPGWIYLLKRHRPLFKWLIEWFLCILMVGYGYQILLFVGRDSIGMYPDIFEEVRVTKFILFGFYLASGFTLKHFLTQKKYFIAILLLLLLFISPIQSLRSLPTGLKQVVMNIGQSILHKPEHHSYLEKAIEYKEDDDSANEIRTINQILKEEKDKFGKQFVLTDLHEVKRSGMKTMITYQDKRGGRSHFFNQNNRRYDSLAFWYHAYTKTLNALKSNNSQIMHDTATELHCNYIISPFSVKHPHWKLLHQGESLHVYKRMAAS